MFSIVFISFLTIVASIVGTLSGFGLGTIMLPVLLFYDIPFSQVVLMVAIIHLFHDISKMALFHASINWNLFLHFGLPTIIATFFGALFINSRPEFLFSFLGIFLMTYSLALLILPDFRLKYTRRNAIIGALTSGFFAGIFGIRGAIRAVFLSAYDFPHKTYISTIGAVSILLDSTRIGVYFWQGIYLTNDLLFGLWFYIIASFVGSYIGGHLIHLIPQGQFRKIVAIFLLLARIRLVVTPFLGLGY